MSRPHNETAEDLAREEATRLFLEKKWKCIIQKLQPMVYKVDWAILVKPNKPGHTNQEALASWAEYKYRNYDWGDFALVMLSLGKWIALRQLAEKTVKPALFITEWACGTLAYISWPAHSGAGYPMTLGGNSRGQDGDIEPVILIPAKNFIVLRGRKNHED